MKGACLNLCDDEKIVMALVALFPQSGYMGDLSRIIGIVVKHIKIL